MAVPGPFNLAAPAVTPTSGHSRRDRELLDRRKNWMFQETDSFLIDSTDPSREKDEPKLFREEGTPDSMRRYMEKGYKDGRDAESNKSSEDSGKRSSKSDMNWRPSQLNTIRSGPLTQTLSGTGLSQPAVMLEAQPLSGGDPMKLDRMKRISSAFKKESVDLRRKEDLDSFRKMINNPFQSGGSSFDNPFGQSNPKTGSESLPGVQITRGLRPTAGLGAPAARGSAFGGAGAPLGGGAFDSRGSSIGGSSGLGSEASRPIKLAPRPIILEIPKRDF